MTLYDLNDAIAELAVGAGAWFSDELLNDLTHEFAARLREHGVVIEES